MKVYVYVVLLKDHVKCVATTIEQARQSLLDQGFSGEEYLKSAEEMQAEFEEDDYYDFLFMEKGCSDFPMYRVPLVGELPKSTSKVTIGITPKQLKQEQDELKSFDWQENEVEINHRIDQAKEDELGW
tara:strand:- start:320 stop:703 length:384 start_codon:yes stop_codon:yes gene_type:complete